MGPRWGRTVRVDLVPDSLLAIFAGEPFDFKPGEQWRYNNPGSFLLGMIIEKLSGKTYGQYLQDEFFTPPGLKGTVYRDQAPIIKRRAQGYEVEPPGGQFSNAEPLSMTQPFAAGSLCSTVTDLVTWAQALSGGKVVSPASYALMTTPGTRSIAGGQSNVLPCLRSPWQPTRSGRSTISARASGVAMLSASRMPLLQLFSIRMSPTASRLLRQSTMHSDR